MAIKGNLDIISTRFKRQFATAVRASAPAIKKEMKTRAKRDVDADKVVAFGSYKKSIKGFVTIERNDLFIFGLDATTQFARNEDGSKYDVEYDYAEAIEEGYPKAAKKDNKRAFNNIKAWLIKKKGAFNVTDSDVFMVKKTIMEKAHKPRGIERKGILTPAVKDSIDKIMITIQKNLSIS